MDNQTLLKASRSALDKPPDLFSFVEKEKIVEIERQKERRVYETPVAIQLPNHSPENHNDDHRDFRQEAQGKSSLIPLGQLQFSRSEILQKSSLTKQEAFKLYIWCGLGKPTGNIVDMYCSKLPSVSTLENPSLLQIRLNTDNEVYVVDLTKNLVRRAASRVPLKSYEPNDFTLPGVIIGRDLAWEEVLISQQFHNH